MNTDQKKGQSRVSCSSFRVLGTRQQAKHETLPGGLQRPGSRRLTAGVDFVAFFSGGTWSLSQECYRILARCTLVKGTPRITLFSAWLGAGDHPKPEASSRSWVDLF